MKRLGLIALLATGCGGEAAGPHVPLEITVERAAGPDIAELQVILAAPSTRFDPLAHPKACTRSWIAADQTLQLTGTDGAKHPSQIIALTGSSTQNVQVEGIPPAKQVLLIVEGISADHKLVASGFKSPIAEITAGDNPPVSVTLTRFDTAVDCDPRY